jgi:hypothetical protein
MKCGKNWGELMQIKVPTNKYRYSGWGEAE